MEKPSVELVGTATVERDGSGFMVLFPDGTVRAFATYAKAIAAIGRIFAKRTPSHAIGVGRVVSYDGSTSTKLVRNGYVVEA